MILALKERMRYMTFAALKSYTSRRRPQARSGRALSCITVRNQFARIQERTASNNIVLIDSTVRGTESSRGIGSVSSRPHGSVNLRTPYENPKSLYSHEDIAQWPSHGRMSSKTRVPSTLGHSKIRVNNKGSITLIHHKQSYRYSTDSSPGYYMPVHTSSFEE